MPKKPVRNAFYFYMKDIEPKLRKEGRVFPNGIPDVVPVAHPLWKALPDSEKAKYEKMARDYKASLRGTFGDKFRMDNVGNVIADRKDPVKELEKRLKKERQTVVASWAGKDIMDELFYFVNFQILCRTEDGHYLPCEMAILEYSLRKGIIRHLHRFICPGPIPTGYRFDCMNHSKNTHQIPIENFELADTDYIKLWTEIENFINYKGEKPEDPPLYCLQEDVEKTEYCLAWIAQQTCIGRPSRYKKVYDLVGLVVDLYAQTDHPNMSATRVHDHLNVNTWDFTRNTRCSWHEERDCKYCSLGIVQRYAFAISDSLSAVLDFQLTDKHMPSIKDDIPACITLPPALYSMRTTQSRPASSRGQRSNWGSGSAGGRCTTQTYKSRPEYADDDDGDDNDDNDFDVEPQGYRTSVRRPNVPGVMWTPAPKPKEPNTTDFSEWPSLGDGPAPVKFAGRVSAPHPNRAPAPPDVWQGGGDHAQNNRRDQGVTAFFQEQRIPIQESRLTADVSNNIPSTSVIGQGRGRGMLGHSGQNKVPVGRGYAPPTFARGVGRGRGYIPPTLVVEQGLQKMSVGDDEK